jgi:hypothetical protein
VTTYLQQLDSRNYIGNVVIGMLGEYFTIRTPDSGLIVDPTYNGLVKAVTINPTQIDLRRVSSTISSFSFKLVDQNRSVTALIEGDASSFLDTEVEIWVGRSDVGMDFVDYFKLPTTRIKKIDYADGEYSFSTQEQTERMNRALFQTATTLDVDILPATTTIDAANVADFPDAGFIKIDNEILSYTGRDLAEKRFTGCSRGLFYTTPEEHKSGAAVYYLERIVGNPVDVLLSLLISGSESGSEWDTLGDGCGIAPELIDLDGILALRDAEFGGLTITAYLYQINGLRWLEEEILTPISCRFTTDGSKLTIKQTDRIAVRPPNSEIGNSTIKGSPKWSVDSSKIVNRIEIQWDFDEATGKYLNTTSFLDDASITKYGEKDKLSFKFKTFRTATGADAVSDFANRTLKRLSIATPEIQVTTHIDKSIFGPVDRVRVVTDQLPDYDGTLDFKSELEIVSRAINYMNGDVSFRLAFVGNSLHNFGFIAPSPVAVPETGFKNGAIRIVSQARLTLLDAAQVQVGWKFRVWKTAKTSNKPMWDFPPFGSLTAFDSGVYEVIGIEGSQVTFDRDIATPFQVYGVYMLRFPAYAECSDDQKRFAFVSPTGAVFADGKRPYKVTY